MNLNKLETFLPSPPNDGLYVRSLILFSSFFFIIKLHKITPEKTIQRITVKRNNMQEKFHLIPWLGLLFYNLLLNQVRPND